MRVKRASGCFSPYVGYLRVWWTRPALSSLVWWNEPARAIGVSAQRAARLDVSAARSQTHACPPVR